MTFGAILALAIAALVAAPYLAHRLRRQRASALKFAAVRFAKATPPTARQRSSIEQRPLFALRAAAIALLALLGATPFLHCSRLALSRGGASVAVAIVLDDSMSMRTTDARGRSRFERARKGAEDVLASLRDGDAAAIVLAGGPARVGLAATTDISAATAALEGITPSDRATDLDGAVAIAKTLIGELPQIDRRVVVLSDLADGRPDAPAIGEGESLPVWVAMPELADEPSVDCAVLAADRAGPTVRVRYGCVTAEAARGRALELRLGDRVLASAPLAEAALGEASVPMTTESLASPGELTVKLTGRDGVASNDAAPVVSETSPAALAVVGGGEDEGLATGGAPVAEQALDALRVDMAVRPLPEPPDRREDYAPFAALLLDDPAGLTPEQRHALTAFLDRGGVALLALGRRAASPPLGANFEPLLARHIGWAASPAEGADPASGVGLLGEAASSLSELDAKGRATLEPEDLGAYDVLARWGDGAPLVLRRARGRGEVWLVTLPFSVEASDLALRPAFLALLDAFVAEAKARTVARRSDVGVPWTFPGGAKVEAKGPGGPLEVQREDGFLRLVPPVSGAYELTIDGEQELRVAAPIAGELDPRRRKIAPAATAASQGGGSAKVDVSWVVALLLLASTAAELVLRAVSKRPEVTGGAGPDAGDAGASGGASVPG